MYFLCGILEHINIINTLILVVIIMYAIDAIIFQSIPSYTHATPYISFPSYLYHPHVMI